MFLFIDNIACCLCYINALLNSGLTEEATEDDKHCLNNLLEEGDGILRNIWAAIIILQLILCLMQKTTVIYHIVQYVYKFETLVKLHILNCQVLWSKCLST